MRLFAVVLALVVPVQGMTAVAAGQCMTLGHHEGGAYTADGHGMHTHAGEGAAAPHHESTGDHGAQDAHCPPCVSCCAAAAIASSPMQFPPRLPGGWVVAAPSAFFSGVAPESPDRPPLAL